MGTADRYFTLSMADTMIFRLLSQVCARVIQKAQTSLSGQYGDTCLELVEYVPAGLRGHIITSTARIMVSKKVVLDIYP